MRTKVDSNRSVSRGAPACLLPELRAAVALSAVCWFITSAAARVPECVIPSEAPRHAASRDRVQGHYAAVSESEWTLELWLHGGGKAEVLLETWQAGEYDRRTSAKHRGTWSIVRGYVTLEYNARCETLAFDPLLSFADFGRAGAAKGFRGIQASISNSLFAGRSLWDIAGLRNMPEPD